MITSAKTLFPIKTSLDLASGRALYTRTVGKVTVTAATEALLNKQIVEKMTLDDIINITLTIAEPLLAEPYKERINALQSAPWYRRLLWNL